MHPSLQAAFEGLEASRSRVLAALAGLDPAALNRSPVPGRWSALQVLHHVATAEALTVAYVRKKMQTGGALPRAGVASRLRLLALRLALASPLRIRAPGAAAVVPDRDELSAVQARWDEVRGELRLLLEAFPEELVDRVVFRHPYAGPMGLADTLGMLQAHLDHHVRQVIAAVRDRR